MMRRQFVKHFFCVEHDHGTHESLKLHYVYRAWRKLAPSTFNHVCLGWQGDMPQQGELLVVGDFEVKCRFP